jgi:hypothetical protein
VSSSRARSSNWKCIPWLETSLQVPLPALTTTLRTNTHAYARKHKHTCMHACAHARTHAQTNKQTYTRNLSGAFICATNHYIKSRFPGLAWDWVACTLNPYFEGNNTDAIVVCNSECFKRARMSLLISYSWFAVCMCVYIYTRACSRACACVCTCVCVCVCVRARARVLVHMRLLRVLSLMRDQPWQEDDAFINETREHWFFGKDDRHAARPLHFARARAREGGGPERALEDRSFALWFQQGMAACCRSDEIISCTSPPANQPTAATCVWPKISPQPGTGLLKWGNVIFLCHSQLPFVSVS